LWRIRQEVARYTLDRYLLDPVYAAASCTNKYTDTDTKHIDKTHGEKVKSTKKSKNIKTEKEVRNLL